MTIAVKHEMQGTVDSQIKLCDLLNYVVVFFSTKSELLRIRYFT